MPFLQDLAKAHQNHEGWFKGSVSFRQNNPGNLRGKNGVFLTFSTYAEGFNALQYDLRSKIFGTAPSIKRYMQGTGKTYQQLVMQEYVAIYAPSADRNNPIAYCNVLCRNLSKYNLTPETPLSVMAQLIRGEIQAAPHPVLPMTLEQRYEAIQNALKWAEPPRRNALIRLMERIQKRLFP